jgi:mono/diheme cytochrome c family protein
MTTATVSVRAWYCGAALGVAAFICALIVLASPAVHAQQARTTRDGVYSAAQAKRGEAIYQQRCGSCHGATLGGELGPPLTGPDFFTVWGNQPLATLADKITATMPLDAPGTLSRPQSAEIVAYVLQVNKFPAGNADLDASDAALKQIALASTVAPAAPAAAGAARPAAGATLSFPPVGNMNQLMRGILFPSSNILFDTQTQDPSVKRPATGNDATTVTARYGNIYDPWVLVDIAAIALAESAPLLMTPGRRCENGKPVPVENADWQQYVQGLVEAGRAAYKAAQTRKQEAVAEMTSTVAEACANCHRVYRDRRGAAMRCTAAP